MTIAANDPFGSGSESYTASEFLVDGFSTVSGPPEEWMEKIKTIAASVAASTAALTISSAKDRVEMDKAGNNKFEATLAMALDNIAAFKQCLGSVQEENKKLQDALEELKKKLCKDENGDTQETTKDLQSRLLFTKACLEQAQDENKLLRLEMIDYKVRLAEFNEQRLDAGIVPIDTTTRSVTKVTWEILSFAEKWSLGEPIQSERVQAETLGLYSIYLSMHFIKTSRLDQAATTLGIWVHVLAIQNEDDGAFPVSLSGTKFHNWHYQGLTMDDRRVISCNGGGQGWNHFAIKDVNQHGVVDGSLTVEVTVRLQPVLAGVGNTTFD